MAESCRILSPDASRDSGFVAADRSQRRRGTCPVSAAITTRRASSSNSIPSGMRTPSRSCSLRRSSSMRRVCAGKEIKSARCVVTTAS